MPPQTVSEKTIGRLSLYRHILNDLGPNRSENIYSHQIATMIGGTAAQVRRDLMAIGFTGSPVRGYNVVDLIRSIGDFLDSPRKQNVALIGVGNIGRGSPVPYSIPE